MAKSSQVCNIVISLANFSKRNVHQMKSIIKNSDTVLFHSFIEQQLSIPLEIC